MKKIGFLMATLLIHFSIKLLALECNTPGHHLLFPSDTLVDLTSFMPCIDNSSRALLLAVVMDPDGRVEADWMIAKPAKSRQAAMN